MCDRWYYITPSRPFSFFRLSVEFTEGKKTVKAIIEVSTTSFICILFILFIWLRSSRTRDPAPLVLSPFKKYSIACYRPAQRVSEPNELVERNMVMSFRWISDLYTKTNETMVFGQAKKKRIERERGAGQCA